MCGLAEIRALLYPTSYGKERLNGVNISLPFCCIEDLQKESMQKCQNTTNDLYVGKQETIKEANYQE